MAFVINRKHFAYKKNKKYIYNLNLFNTTLLPSAILIETIFCNNLTKYSPL